MGSDWQGLYSNIMALAAHSYLFHHPSTSRNKIQYKLETVIEKFFEKTFVPKV